MGNDLLNPCSDFTIVFDLFAELYFVLVLKRHAIIAEFAHIAVVLIK